MYIKELILSSIILIILDIFYLYNTKNNINYKKLILYYSILIFGINYFIIQKRNTFNEAFMLGIFVFSFVYLMNNDNNALDILWGGLLFGLTTCITYSFTKQEINFENIHPASIIN